MTVIAVSGVAVAERFQIQFKGFAVGGFGYCFVNISLQYISVGEAATFVNPIILLSAAVKFALCKNRLPMFTANLIGNLTELVMVGDMVFKLPAGLKGYGINNKMVMDIICIKVH